MRAMDRDRRGPGHRRGHRLDRDHRRRSAAGAGARGRAALGYDLEFAGSESFRDLIATDHKRYGTVIRAAGIAPN